MGRHQIDVRVHTTADAATLYALLADGTSWPAWAPMRSFELERAGETGGESVGAVRVFRSRWRSPRSSTRERIVELVPGRRFSYVLLSGLPLRDYRADVDLAPEGDGTSIHWHSTFDVERPGTGWLYRRTLQRFIRACATGLAEHAVTAQNSAPR